MEIFIIINNIVIIKICEKAMSEEYEKRDFYGLRIIFTFNKF